MSLNFDSLLLARASISFLHVSNAEHKCEEQAEGTHCNVANSKEVVLSSKGVGGRENEALLSLERSYLILIVNFKLVATCLESILNSAPKFSEIWETCCSHPDDEVLILFHVDPLNLVPCFSGWKVFVNVFEFVINIGLPSDFVF